MVGILVSFWEGLFSGAMLVSGRVPEKNHLDAKFWIFCPLECSILQKNMENEGCPFEDIDGLCYEYGRLG